MVRIYPKLLYLPIATATLTGVVVRTEADAWVEVLRSWSILLVGESCVVALLADDDGEIRLFSHRHRRVHQKAACFLDSTELLVDDLCSIRVKLG